MGQSNCGRPAAAFAMILLGLPPAFAMDRDAGGAARAAEVIAVPGLDSEAALAGRPCPTRFDYVVLASFADSPSPRMFSHASSTTTIRPPKMSSGLCLSAPSPGNALR